MKKLILILFMLLCIPALAGVQASFSENDDYVYFNDVDNPSNVQEIKSELKASSKIDGDLTSEIYVIIDNYTGNEKILGDFIIVFGVIDNYGVESTIAITVRNVDVNPPIITFDQPNFIVPHHADFSKYHPRVRVHDAFEGDLTQKVSVDGLESVDTSVLGFYPVTYTISDSSGNIATKTIEVHVKDVNPPVINGPTEIYKHAEHIMKPNFFLDYFTASDNIDGNLTSSIQILSNNYIGNADKRGDYRVTLMVEDAAGNRTTHELTIKVRNDIDAYLIIDKYHWFVPNNQRLNEQHFIDILKGLNDIPNRTYIFTTNQDSYSVNWNKNGSYTRSFNLLASSGEEYDRLITLTVINPNANIINQAPTIIDNVWHWTKVLFVPGIIVTLFVIGLVKSKK